MWIFDYNNIELSNCTFYYNYARSRGGGIYYKNIDSISIIDCIFENNKVLVYGGGLFCGGQQYLIVDKCTFKLNSAWSPTIGGTIFSHGSAIYLDYPANPFNLITNNYFFNNKSLSTVAILTSASFVCNNVFTNNYNWDVLTFNCDESAHLVVNNIFANNFYESGIPGVLSISQDLRFYNNILWNNFSDEYNDDDMALTSYSYPPADVQHCLVWEGRIDGTNIITDDPIFVDPAPNYGLESNGWEYDWSLRDESPAVNAGTPDITGLNLPPYDIAGNPRIFGNRIDMGAYENQHVFVTINDTPVSEELKLFPNPGTNKLTIQILPEMKNCFIDLYNGQGMMIMHNEIKNINTVFTTENLSSGIYHYRIYNKNKIYKNGTWIKL